MADTIRDVIIRIAIQQKDSTLKVPDIAPAINQINTVTDAANKIDFSPVITELRGMREALEAAGKGVVVVQQAAKSREIDQLAIQLRRTREELMGVSRESRTAANDVARIGASSLQLTTVGDRLKGTGEGALQLAKGIGYLTAANEAELAQVLKIVSAAEGMFSLFRGGVELFKNTNELLVAMRAASAAATAQEVARGEASAAANVAATGGLTRMLGVINPVVGGLAAILAVGGLATLAFRGMGKDAGDAGDELGKLKDRAKTARDELLKMRMKDGEIDAFGIKGRDLDAEINNEAINVALNLKAVRIGALNDRERELAVANGLMTVEKQLNELANARAFTAQQLGRETNEEGRAMLLERLKTIDEQRLTILNQQAEKLREARTTQEEMAKAARDNIAAEEKRLSSLDGIVGRMNEIEQMELRRLGEKAKGGGEFSKAELNRLEQLGGAGTSDFVNKQFAAIGQREGGADLFAPFFGKAQRGQGSDLQSLKESLRLLADPLGGGEGGMDGLAREIAANAKERQKVMGQLIDVLREDVAGKAEVDQLRAKVTVLEQRLRDGKLRDRGAL